MELLNKIQRELKAPKNQRNSFGNYNYRSCEDILEAVKPLLGEGHLTLTDKIVAVGGRIYVKATATLRDAQNKMVQVSAYAREPESRKGMDESQLTGATSSYARKYALNGLFCIDDNKDADTQPPPQPRQYQQPTPPQPVNSGPIQPRQTEPRVDNVTPPSARQFTTWTSKSGKTVECPMTRGQGYLSQPQIGTLEMFRKNKKMTDAQWESYLLSTHGQRYVEDCTYHIFQPTMDYFKNTPSEQIVAQQVTSAPLEFGDNPEDPPI